MSTVAEQLRQGREARNLTVEQVAEITKIRTDHLRALEEGHYDLFSAPVYIRGFVRTYATLLKLDVKQVMETLEQELGRTERFAEPPSLSSAPKGVVDVVTLQLSKVDWHKGVTILSVLVVLALAVLGFLLWRHYHQSDPLKRLEPGIYQKSGRGGETLPVPNPAPRR
ncbi:MAG TPA: helix-turn-helix transcriptional regulator [Candidatus Paceibacterota bacterium]|nr:helix-turn-helix transcriptional regulator [Candidatus Paceibacterota bacterium]